MTRNIILKHAGGELANQLWNYISVYAYSLEIGAETRNPSFYEYHNFFNFLKDEKIRTKLYSLFFKVPRRRSHWINKVFRIKYKIEARIIESLHKSSTVSSQNTSNKTFPLPPSLPLTRKSKDLYFTGWLFRNPIGIEKFRPQIIQAFKPTKTIEKKVEEIISDLNSKYKNIIGLHIRQGDYKTFRNGKYLINQKRVAEICHQYLEKVGFDSKNTVFLITSDGKIEGENFADLQIYTSKENAVTDLFLLSKTQAIIGSDSSFGHFSAWYGNIPQIVLKNEEIDWQYYEGKDKYFINKYLELLPL